MEGIRGGHALCVPFPAQGHINPMLQFAKILHSKYNFHITFLNSEFNHNRLLNSRGPSALDGLPHFRFESIPDGLEGGPTQEDVEGEGATQDTAGLCESMSRTCLPHVMDLVSRVNLSAPPVTCIVSDGVMMFTMKAAEELGVPEVVFWTMSACGFMGYAQYRALAAKGLFPLEDASCLTNGYLDTPVEWLPGMKNVRMKDLPTFIRTTNPDDFMFNFMANEVEITSKASAIILNTFEALERDVLNSFSSIQHPKLPPVYSIGPLELLVDQIPKDDPVHSIVSSLWKDQLSCIDWLDSKEDGSVLYVNFGSVAVMTSDQLIEFAWGLANSKKQFLWVIRPGIVRGASNILPEEFELETKDRGMLANTRGASNILPEEFELETKDRGMLASWCPQKEVLRHRSIGGFLTHSGWNSTLETICGGVPVLCWPFFAEQQTNCRYSCVEWEIGMEIDNDVKRDEVEKLVRVLMEEEKGKEMKRRAVGWKNDAQEAAKPGGSSSKNLDKLVTEVLAS